MEEKAEAFGTGDETRFGKVSGVLRNQGKEDTQPTLMRMLSSRWGRVIF